MLIASEYQTTIAKVQREPTSAKQTTIVALLETVYTLRPIDRVID